MSISFLYLLVITFEFASLQFGNLDLTESAVWLYFSNDLLLLFKSFVTACIMAASGLFRISGFNTLTANYEYSRSNRENLPLPIQMQLSEKPKIFCQFFIAFLESTLNFEHFETKKKNESHNSSISEVIDSERRAYLNA